MFDEKTNPWMPRYPQMNNRQYPMVDDIRMHFYYPYESVKDEIKMRSSYLGKLRRTEEAQHLLDLIYLSDDEADIFQSFAKSAMADVFDKFNMYLPNLPKAYHWSVGCNTIAMPTLPTPTLTNNITGTGATNGIQLGGSVTDTTSPVIDHTTYGLEIPLEITFTIAFRIQATNSVVKQQYTTKYTIPYTCMVHGTNNVWSVTNAPIVPVQLAKAGIATSAEWIDSVDTIVYNGSPKVVELTPTTINEGDFVTKTDSGVTKLYMALQQTDTSKINFDDVRQVELQAADYRDSIHYFIALPDRINSAMVAPLDTAIFNALVARILFKWLQYAYPNEAEMFQDQYIQECDAIEARCTHFIKDFGMRAPRIF